MGNSEKSVASSSANDSLTTAISAARTYHELVRSQFNLQASALAPYIERGCFNSTLTYNGEPSNILDRFPQWARERALAVEADLVRETSQLYQNLLDTLNLSGDLPEHFSQTTLTSESHELACLTRIDDLADLATALLPLATSVLRLAPLSS